MIAPRSWADSAEFRRQLQDSGRERPGVAGEQRHVDGIRPAIGRMVEHVGTAHQRDVASAATMHGAGLAARDGIRAALVLAVNPSFSIAARAHCSMASSEAWTRPG